MSDFAFTNIVLITYVSLFIGFPLLTIFQTIYHRTYSVREKSLWIALILLTWPIMMAGSLIFAFKNYRLPFGFIPLGLVLLVMSLSLIFIKDIIANSATAGLTNNQRSIATEFLGKPLEPPVREKLNRDIETLKSEMAENPNLREPYNDLNIYMSDLFLDEFSDEDFERWNYVFDHRAMLDDPHIKEFMKNNR